MDTIRRKMPTVGEEWSGSGSIIAQAAVYSCLLVSIPGSTGSLKPMKQAEGDAILLVFDPDKIRGRQAFEAHGERRVSSDRGGKLDPLKVGVTRNSIRHPICSVYAGRLARHGTVVVEYRGSEITGERARPGRSGGVGGEVAPEPAGTGAELPARGHVPMNAGEESAMSGVERFGPGAMLLPVAGQSEAPGAGQALAETQRRTGGPAIVGRMPRVAMVQRGSRVEHGSEGAETELAANADLRTDGRRARERIVRDGVERGGEIGGRDDARFPIAKRSRADRRDETGGLTLIGCIGGAAEVFDPAGSALDVELYRQLKRGTDRNRTGANNQQSGKK